jgi:hypothetical protein
MCPCHQCYPLIYSVLTLILIVERFHTGIPSEV